MIALLHGCAALGGSVDLGKALEGGLSPDDEAAEAASRSQPKEVQAIHVGGLHTGDVPHGLADAVVLVVDHQRAQAADIAAVARLALAGTDLLGVHDLLQLISASQLLEGLDGCLGLGQGLEAIGDDQGQLCHLADAVSAGHDQRRQAAGSQGHGHGVALLGHVHAAVPAAPDAGWVEHATSACLVAEGGLASAVGSTTRGTGDTCHSTACAPRLGGGVVASLGADCIGLALVLGHVHVHIADEVRAER